MPDRKVDLMHPDAVHVFPTSFAQERLWIAEQVTPGTAAYHVPVAIRLVGRLDTTALARALDLVVARHESLRSVFTQIGGRTVQVVTPAAPVTLQIDDEPRFHEGPLDALIAAEAARPFDLERGPLVRTRLVRLAADEHVLVLTLHHLVCDMWSCGVLMTELSAGYNAFVAGREPELAELAVQYADFAIWQRDNLDARREQLLGYWRERLAGASPLIGLPTDRPRPATQTFLGAQTPASLSAETSARVTRFAREHRATPFTVLLAAFDALVGRYTGLDDVVISTGVGTRSAQTDPLIGCFINIVPLRTSLAGRPTFAELVTRVGQATIGALAHQDLPFEKLIEDLAPKRDLSYNPYAQVMFIVQNAPAPTPSLVGLTVDAIGADRGATQCDLNVQLHEHAGALTGFIEYGTDLFDADTIERMWSHFQTLLEAALSTPDAPVDELPMLTTVERGRAVMDWNDTAAPFADACLHELFASNAAARPHACAIAGPRGSLSYGQLDARAEAVARRLRDIGVGPGALVGLCVEPSPAMAEGMLGVLKAGGAYLPLDPQYPRERLAFMLADARPVALLTQRSLRDRLSVDGGIPVLCLDDEADRDTARTAGPAGPSSVARPHDLAYVIYTSGSTGQPKGVSVTHRGVVNNVTDLNRLAEVGPADRVLALSPLSFDMSVYEVLGMLAAGGTVVVPDQARAKEPRHWLELIDEHGITVWNSAPTLLEALVDAATDRPPGALRSLRVAFLGGDWIAVTLPDRSRELSPDLRFISLGGATEASIHSVIFPVDRTDPRWVSIPYGRPMANQQLLIVDEAMRPVPVGVPGELCLGGIGLARGYLRRPALTASRFVPHPYAGEFPNVSAGARLYRTGDLARYRPDGVVELLGRLDQQVKVRGHRVELGEIAAALRGHAAVVDAVATVHRSTTDEAGRLAAFYVPSSHPGPTASELRAHLKTTLPDYMIPQAFVPLDALPLSPNGKVDSNALPALAASRPTLDVEFVPPRTALERAIADIWVGVLPVETVGVCDDFFDLGGQSLLATQVVSLLRESFRVDVPLRVVFEAPTVAAQAQFVADAGRDSGVDVDTIATVFLQVSQMTDDQARSMLGAVTEEAR